MLLSSPRSTPSASTTSTTLTSSIMLSRISLSVLGELSSFLATTLTTLSIIVNLSSSVPSGLTIPIPSRIGTTFMESVLRGLNTSLSVVLASVSPAGTNAERIFAKSISALAR